MVILYFKEEQEDKKSEGRNRSQTSSNNAVVPNKTYSIENTHTHNHTQNVRGHMGLHVW